MAQAPSLSLPTLGGDTPNFGNLPLPPAIPSSGTPDLPPTSPQFNIETPEDRANIAQAISELPPEGPQILTDEDTPAETSAFQPPPPPPPTIAARPTRLNLPPPISSAPQNNARRNQPPPLSIGVGLPPIGGGEFALPLFAGSQSAERSWEVPLEPTHLGKKTRFNYKHVTLPQAVYRHSYDRENQHLPVRYTQANYDAHYLHAVARNDIDTTRAFLNAGHDVNMRNSNGDNALSIALQFGAFDTARLLVARGADPFAPGYMGISAIDYAQQLGAQSVLASIRQHFGA